MSYCQICDIDITCDKSEILRHSKSARRLTNMKECMTNPSISKFMENVPTNSDGKRAEIKLAGFIAARNLPFSLMDDLVTLCKDIFPDSNIAKKVSMRRTKVTATIKNCLGHNYSEILYGKLRRPGIFFFSHHGRNNRSKFHKTMRFDCNIYGRILQCPD